MLTVPYEVKKALKQGRMRKEYKFKVYDDSNVLLFTMDNDDLVAESVKIDERMCSDKIIKFGLCEGSSLEFQYFNHDNINGKQIQAFLSVEYIDSDNEVAWYDIPMGWFTVDSCSKQFSTGIHKVTAFNKLKSEYLDVKANELTLEGFSSSSISLTMYDIRRLLLSDFQIDIDKSRGYTPTGPGGSYPTMTYSLGSNYRFSALYGIDTPFSSEMYNEAVGTMPTLSSNIDLRINSTRIHYDPTRVFELDYLAGTLYGLEQNFKQYLIDLFDGAQLKQSGNLKTGQDFINYICANIGFQYIFGITGLSDAGPYSTIQWEYEEQNNITHTVAGTLYDCMNKVWNPPQYGITVYVPSAVTSDVFPTSIFYISYANTYKYYSDSGYSDIVTKEYPRLYNSDGSVFTSLLNDFEVYNISGAMTDADLITIQPSQVSDYTLRDITSAVFELNTQYGQLDRETDLFTGVELNQGGLYPADTLYPDNALYPSGNMEHPFPSTYQKLWTDTVGEQSFRYLIITYKAMENGQEVEKKLQRTVNEHGTTNYNMSDNWLFRNLVWDAADVGAYADAMVLKMRDIKWFPFEMWAAGLPYVETGDAIEITDKEGDTYVSYILQRQLNGIQNLQDTYINGELDIF